MRPHAFMIFWLGLALAAAGAEPVVIQSQSGQFLTRGPSLVRAASAPAPAVEPGHVLLDPALLAVSCEAVKQALLEALDIRDQWRHQVWLTIDHTRAPGDRDILVEAVRYLDQWRYRLSVPASVERRHLVRTLIHLLLLEMAQRNAREPVADLPPWLGDGLLGVIEAHHPVNLALAPYSHVAGHQYRRDPLAEVRRLLQQTAPYTLEELNWPGSDERFGRDQDRYLGCSHVLVHELLRLPGGTEAIHGLLANLPGHLNWQTAFLKASPFQTMLDLDKWWSLIIVQMTGRELMFTWSAEETWQRLEEVLATPVQVRVRSSDLPMTTRASLQSVVREWDFRRQLPLLQSKASHLQALRLRAAQGLVEVVDGYRLVLERYLLERRPEAERRGEPPLLLRPFSRGRPNYDLLVQETLQQLDELDARRGTVQRLMRAAEAHRATPPVQPARPIGQETAGGAP